MHRCFANPERWVGDRVSLSPEESHHLQHVLRARKGEIVQVFNGQGRVATARITGSCGPPGSLRQREELTLTILGEIWVAPWPLRITLVQAIPRHVKMDFIVEKATELGVARIVPVECDRVVPRRDNERMKLRFERWRRIVIQAARQCGANWLPEVCQPEPFFRVAERCREFDVCLLGSLQQDVQPLRNVLRKLDLPPQRNVALMIGPEGDFSPEEVKIAVAAGAVPVTFGPLVMRVETAAIFGLSVLLYELS